MSRVFTCLGPVLAGLLVPRAALACTVCGATKEESAWAFLLTTGLLTFLPLLILGTAGYFIRKRIFELHDLADVERQAPPAE